MFVCDNRLVFLLNIEGNHWFTDITQAERREGAGEGKRKLIILVYNRKMEVYFWNEERGHFRFGLQLLLVVIMGLVHVLISLSTTGHAAFLKQTV